MGEQSKKIKQQKSFKYQISLRRNFGVEKMMRKEEAHKHQKLSLQEEAAQHIVSFWELQH